MKDEYGHLDQREALKVENEVIKMKLMLEHGAEFRYDEKAEPISPETEHEFLNYIVNFEKQEALARELTVFEVLGSPGQFPDADEVGEDRIRGLLEELMGYMMKRGIELSVLSPNVGHREIYRFITRELFAHRMLHINMPGMITCFIYDEFHPDHPYENSRTAVNECMKDIFSTHDLQWTFQYEQRLELNGREGLTLDEFRKTVNGFKKRFGSIEPLCIEVEDCQIQGDTCVASGRFEICFTTLQDHVLKTGIWSVRFRYWKEMDLWMISGVQVEGIEFAD
jgi:hypothetical protein